MIELLVCSCFELLNNNTAVARPPLHAKPRVITLTLHTTIGASCISLPSSREPTKHHGRYSSYEGIAMFAASESLSCSAARP